MDALQQILQIASETKGKVDMLLDQGRIQDDRLSALDGRVRAVETALPTEDEIRDQETRLRRVEKRQWLFVGGAGVSAWILSNLAAMFHVGPPHN